jgi:hypothetical protein
MMLPKYDLVEIKTCYEENDWNVAAVVLEFAFFKRNFFCATRYCCCLQVLYSVIITSGFKLQLKIVQS